MDHPAGSHKCFYLEATPIPTVYDDSYLRGD